MWARQDSLVRKERLQHIGGPLQIAAFLYRKFIFEERVQAGADDGPLPDHAQESGCGWTLLAFLPVC